MNIKPFVQAMLLAAVVLTACAPQAAPTQAPPSEPPPPAATNPPPPEPSVTPPPEPTAEPPAAYSPDPVVVTFQAGDGQELSGTFLPAAVENAPVVVLMHQINMNGTYEWEVIADWLQNRGRLKESYDNPNNETFRDPSWFPAMPAGMPLAVFYFTFRGCDSPNGCPGFDPKGWQLDAVAAVRTAAAQPGVDPAKVIAIGTSIGADGAVDGCMLAQAGDGTSRPCLAVMPISPGGYLNLPYPDTVDAVLAAGSVNVTCAAPEKESEQKGGCLSYKGEKYAAQIVPKGGHGIYLADPSLSPDLLSMMLDFLNSALSGG